jgi:type III secretion system YscQ/HrcQ family protein
LNSVHPEAATPLQLTKLSDNAVEAWQRVFASARLIEDVDLQFTWRYVLPDADALAGQAIELKGNRVRVVLLIERDVRTQNIEMREWFDFPNDSKLLAFALANEGLIGQLSRWFGESLIPNALIDHGQLLAYSRQGLAVRYQLAKGPDRAPISNGFLWLTPTLLKQLSEQAQPMLVGLPSWLSQLDIPMSAALEPIELSVADLQSMRQGDVIGLGAKSQALAQGIIDAPGFQRWQGKFGKDGLRAQRQVLARAHVGMSAYSFTQHQDLAMEPQQSAAVDQVNVQLGFELERRVVNLAELTQLQAGYVFKLAAPSEGRNVNLLANGKVIGTGELVSVGDFLGVRIIDLQR